MKKTVYILLCVLVLFTYFITACGNNKQTVSTDTGTAEDIPRPDYIPQAAWAHTMGTPYREAGRPYSWHIMDDPPWSGAPLGGMGAGSIGRSYRGDFSRWHMDIGTHAYKPVPACAFSVFTDDGNTKQAHVMTPYKTAVLPAWNRDMPAEAGTYYALYPKSWYVYHWDVLPVELSQKQFSPVIPGNYRETSYPIGIFAWSIGNPSNKEVTVSIMFSWQNLVGFEWGKDTAGGNYNTVVKKDGYTGIVLNRKADPGNKEWNGSYAIMTTEQPGVSITYNTRFDTKSDTVLWADFSDDGMLKNTENPAPSVKNETIGAALVVTVKLGPGQKTTIPFSLAWDFPVTAYNSGTAWYKRYTRFFGTEGTAAAGIAVDGLVHRNEWEKAIDNWQKPILDSSDRPDWFKCALFNELYYLVDGGSVWENGPVKKGPDKEGIGHFAYLETYDYPFYNTFDVHFYASFALAMLWPEIQKSIIKDFADTVNISDKTLFKVDSTGEQARKKVRGAIPHDLGSPTDDPWLHINAYSWRDINIWKDLNSKFVLQVYRDYKFTRDSSLVDYCWPAVTEALEYLHSFDRNGNHLPDHAGLPDQTYDNWIMTGDSAYTGGLWIAALEAAIKMGRMVGDDEKTALYSIWLKESRAAFIKELWNGSYYNFDASDSMYHDSIMADQLAGQWYADAAGLECITKPEQIKTALYTIYKLNVMGFGDGTMGAVNGMRPDGSVDTSCDQSQEVWTGTTYGLASLMLHEGMTEEAWQTAWGVYNVVYNRGYWFRTPEAYIQNGDYRASMYMRPLSIWALEYAATHRISGK
jgi:non-lysosomal glucosylceramidase